MTGAELRERRKALSLRQVDLARLLSVTESTVARWEQGRLQIAHPEMVDLALEALEVRQAT